MFDGLVFTLVQILPDDFSKLRVWYYNSKGCEISKKATLSPNVRIRGQVFIDEGSSVAQNCTLSGEKVGIKIGKNVMIAPNVVIVAFSHEYSRMDIPMAAQGKKEEAVIIEDDVWIASNCTIGKGVTIGKGAVIGANSYVGKNVLPYSVVGGVPAKELFKRDHS